MRKGMIITVLALLGAMSVSCSNEDDDQLSKVGDATRTTAGDETAQGKANSLSTVLYLRTIDGKETTTFKVGENILFDLEITNVTDSVVKIGPFDPNIIRYDVFTVYTDDGKIIGSPTKIWDETAIMKYYCIQSGQALKWKCTWLKDDNVQPTHPMIHADDLKPLPVGKYYTEFILNGEKNMVNSWKREVIHKDFEVVE